MAHGKVPSIPGNESQAVINALALMAEREKQSLPAFLADVEVINFGTTVATNAMLQHRGVPTAMLTSRGFRDMLELRRGFKEVLFDIRLPPPQQIVRREWRLPITERIDYAGAVLEALMRTMYAPLRIKSQPAHSLVSSLLSECVPQGGP
jgi:N-methylhydantoinase A